MFFYTRFDHVFQTRCHKTSTLCFRTLCYETDSEKAVSQRTFSCLEEAKALQSSIKKVDKSSLKSSI